MKKLVKDILKTSAARRADFAKAAEQAKSKGRRERLEGALQATEAAEKKLVALIHTAEEHAECQKIERSELFASVESTAKLFDERLRDLEKALKGAKDAKQIGEIASKVRQIKQQSEDRMDSLIATLRTYDGMARTESAEQNIRPVLVGLKMVVRTRQGTSGKEALLEGLETAADIALGPPAAILLAVNRLAQRRKHNQRAADEEAEYLELYLKGLAAWTHEADHAIRRMQRLIDDWS